MQIEPLTITRATIHDAWRACANDLLVVNSCLNLVVHITEPSTLLQHEIRRLDPRSVDSRAKSVFDVAATIFPRPTSRRNLAPDDFAEYYLPIYLRLKRRRSGWGFYFERLVCFGPSHAPQLTRVIDGLSGWGRNHHGAFVIHFSSADTDRPRRRGGPCLQYVQLTPDAAKLSLTAVYRSHDYFHKALGNFLGLSRLLSYVCNHTGHEVGTLTCLSTYAFIGTSRRKLLALLSK